MIGHAGAAGDAVDQAFGLFQHAFEDALGIRQLPQHIHVDAAVAAGNFVRNLSLGDTALNGSFHHFFMTFRPRSF